MARNTRSWPISTCSRTTPISARARWTGSRSAARSGSSRILSAGRADLRIWGPLRLFSEALSTSSRSRATGDISTRTSRSTSSSRAVARGAKVVIDPKTGVVYSDDGKGNRGDVSTTGAIYLAPDISPSELRNLRDGLQLGNETAKGVFTVNVRGKTYTVNLRAAIVDYNTVVGGSLFFG